MSPVATRRGARSVRAVCPFCGQTVPGTQDVAGFLELSPHSSAGGGPVCVVQLILGPYKGRAAIAAAQAP